jgi:acyl-coenzyme A thioesterase PaaI-like protein
MTLGIEPVAADGDEVVMKMPLKPEISQATGLFSAGALVQLADVAATWLCSLRLRDWGAPEGTFPFAGPAQRQPCGEHRSRRRPGAG